MACRKSGRERVTTRVHNLCHHWAQRKQGIGCLIALGGVANCPELPSSQGRDKDSHLHAVMQQKSKVSHTIRFTVSHKSATLCRNETTWPSDKRKMQCCGAQPTPRNICAQPESLGTVHRITTLLNGASGCDPGSTYLQKTFGKYFLNLIPPQHLQE